MSEWRAIGWASWLLGVAVFAFDGKPLFGFILCGWAIGFFLIDIAFTLGAWRRQ